MSKTDRPDQPNVSARFNKQAATYAPRRSGASDLEEICKVLKTLSARSEVCRMQDVKGRGEWSGLLLIDGGKGQLSIVRGIWENAGDHDFPVMGVAKGPDRNAGREICHLPNGRQLTLLPNAPLLFYLQHRAKRAKSLTTSSLDEVPGIGPNRKRALLMHFGTACAVKGAALDDLERAPGISKTMARQLHDYFHPQG